MIENIIFTEMAKSGISVIAKSLFERVISAWGSHNLIARSLVRSLSQGDGYINYLTKHVARVIRIRTIHSNEHDVFLNDIYHPLKISKVNNLNQNHTISVCDDFFIENGNISNIIGVAGQGKSTILRKLFIEQIKNGTKIPFFIELHKAEKDSIYEQFFCMVKHYCDGDIKNNSIDELLCSNKIILMLDGFDEVKSKNKLSILNEIVLLNMKYGVQIITTTRPGTSICHESNIENYHVIDVNKKDIIDIIIKINKFKGGVDDDFLEKIILTIENNKNLTEVMKTPILVTLFYVCYPYLDIIPNNTVEFYSNLFMTLYLRHDKIKNFDREKSSNLSHTEAYECFCTLCFQSIYENIIEFSEVKLHKLTMNAMKIKDKLVGNKPGDLANDFIDITCLIQRDGYDTFVFLHKSIQEYHAADFIKNVSSEKKCKFYEILKNDIVSDDMRFLSLCTFLLDIDESDACQLLTLPLCEATGVSCWDHPAEDLFNTIREKITSIVDVFFEKNIDGTIFVSGSILKSTAFEWLSIYYRNKNFLSIIAIPMAEFAIDNLKEKLHIFHSDLLDFQQKYTLNEILSIFDLDGLFDKKLREIMHGIYVEVYKKNKQKTKNENTSMKELFDFM